MSDQRNRYLVMEPRIWTVVGGGGTGGIHCDFGGGGGGRVGVRCKRWGFGCGMPSERHFWAREVRMGFRVGWDVIVPAMVGEEGKGGSRL